MKEQAVDFPSTKQVLDAASYIGYCMLRHGAEISRVEDTANRICNAYGVDEACVFAVLSTIIITVSANGETLTQSRRINSIQTNLTRVDRLNDLSRKICEELPSYSYIMRQVHEIESLPLYPPLSSVAIYALIAAAFAFFFDGTAADALAAASIGAVMRLIMIPLEHLHAASFFTTAAASAVGAFGAYSLAALFPVLNAQTVTIALLMNLVPGVALVNSLRDFIATDYMCGLSRLAEALLTATAIALGVAVAMIRR